MTGLRWGDEKGFRGSRTYRWRWAEGNSLPGTSGTPSSLSKMEDSRALNSPLATVSSHPVGDLVRSLDVGCANFRSHKMRLRFCPGNHVLFAKKRWITIALRSAAVRPEGKDDKRRLESPITHPLSFDCDRSFAKASSVGEKKRICGMPNHRIPLRPSEQLTIRY
jgi:hypothetical protein